MEADRKLGDFFRKAEEELAEVAEKYGFSLRLIDDIKGTWYFFPEVAENYEDPEDKFLRLCRAANDQLDADYKAAYEKYSEALKEIEKEFSSGQWPWFKI